MTPYLRGDVTWGFTVSFLKDGVSASDVRVAFDEETTMKHEWVGKGVGLLPRERPTLPARPPRSFALPSWTRHKQASWP